MAALAAPPTSPKREQVTYARLLRCEFTGLEYRFTLRRLTPEERAGLRALCNEHKGSPEDLGAKAEAYLGDLNPNVIVSGEPLYHEEDVRRVGMGWPEFHREWVFALLEVELGRRLRPAWGLYGEDFFSEIGRVLTGVVAPRAARQGRQPRSRRARRQRRAVARTRGSRGDPSSDDESDLARAHPLRGWRA
jgi:hypothetical protein